VPGSLETILENPSETTSNNSLRHEDNNGHLKSVSEVSSLGYVDDPVRVSVNIITYEAVEEFYFSLLLAVPTRVAPCRTKC
jgi:hypothetical protein